MKLNKRATVLAAAAIATGAVGGMTMLDTGNGLAVRAAGANLLASLRARSPGERSGGAVTTKGVRQAAPVVAAATPVSRVLPIASMPAAAAPAIAAPLAAAPVVVPPAAALVPAVLAPAVVPVAAAAGPGLGGAALLPLIPIVGGGGGGGGGLVVTPPGLTPPGETPPGGTPPAVPEPATWAMMILGFGLLGTSLRRRRTSLGRDRSAARASTGSSSRAQTA